MPSDIAAVERGRASLLDPDVPLPPDARFFEMRFDLREIAKRAALMLVTALLAAVLLPAGYVLLDRASANHLDQSGPGLVLTAGAVLGLSAAVWFCSIFSGLRFALRQARGRPTRRGLFVVPEALIFAHDNSTTTVLREQFRSIDADGVKYVVDGSEREASLPSLLNERERGDRYDAVVSWANRSAK